MANTKKYVSLDKLALYDEKIKAKIAADDAAMLKSAKDYADETLTLANNNAASLANTAEANAKAYADGKDALIAEAKQAGTDAAAAAAVADGKAVAAQGEVDALEAYVGTFTASEGVDTVVKYIDAKTANIASDETVGAIADRVTQAEKDIDAIEADYLKAADKTELQEGIDGAHESIGALASMMGVLELTDDYSSIVDYVEYLNNNIYDLITTEEDRAKGVEAGLDARIKVVEEDYLKAADKTELSDAIAAEEARATGIEAGLRTDVDAIKGDYLKATDKEELQGNIDTLTGVVETLRDGIDAEKVDGVIDLINYVEEHGTEVTGMKADIDGNTEAIEGVAGRMTTAEGKITAVEGAVATKVEQSAYDTKIAALEGADTAMAGRLDTLEAIDHEAYVAADAALKAELNGEIAKKADASVVEAMDTAYKAADAGLAGRLDAVEAQLGDGEGSVADMIADAKQEAIDAAVGTAAADATTKANAAEAAAKGYTDTEVGKDRARLDALEAIEHHNHSNKAELDLIATGDKSKWDAAAAKAHEHGNKGVLDGITAENITTWNTVTSKATQSDLVAVGDRVTALETWHENFVECSQEDIQGLFA